MKKFHFEVKSAHNAQSCCCTIDSETNRRSSWNDILEILEKNNIPNEVKPLNCGKDTVKDTCSEPKQK
jgi:hypothetical protein